MQYTDHIRLIWPRRPFVMYGDVIQFDDGLPPPTEAELDATFDQAMALWQAEQAALSVKKWPSRAEFWAEFEQSEKLAILSSEHTAVKALMVELQMWDSEIRANDPRIQNGLAMLVSLNLITENRLTEITHAS